LEKNGSSPNSLKTKELVFSEFPVISWARKKSHLACNHETHISPYRWRAYRLFLQSFLIPPPLRFADDPQGVYGKGISRRCLLRNLTFLPGPWQAFLKNSIESTQSDGKKRIDLKIDGLAIFILRVSPEEKVPESSPGPYLGLDHFGFAVDNLEEIAEELKKKGAEFAVEPKVIRPGVKIAYIRAPENVRIELVERS
jgi:lactoylglutathione lyase